MNQVIYKYPLEIRATQVLWLPLDYWFLSVQFQGPVLTLWAMVDTDRGGAPSKFEIYGTGQSVPELQARYARVRLATVQQPGTDLVWHVFAVRGEE